MGGSLAGSKLSLNSSHVAAVVTGNEWVVIVQGAETAQNASTLSLVNSLLKVQWSCLEDVN